MYQVNSHLPLLMQNLTSTAACLLAVATCRSSMTRMTVMKQRWLLVALMVVVFATLVPTVTASSNKRKKGGATDDPPPTEDSPCAAVPAVCRTNQNGMRQLGPRTTSSGQRVRGPDRQKRKPVRRGAAPPAPAPCPSTGTASICPGTGTSSTPTCTRTRAHTL